MTAKANGERGQERVCHLGQTELIPPSKDEGGAPANHRNTNCKTTRTTN